MLMSEATEHRNGTRVACVQILQPARFGRNGETRRHRQTNSRHLMQICAFAAEQRFLRASSVSMTVPEIINITRRARSLRRGGFARFESDRSSRALKAFSKISFSFCGHNLQRQRPLK